MNTPKTHDNRRVQEFLDGFLTVAELCQELPAVDDIFAGVLALRTGGNTATRSLSRRALFLILQGCETIDVASVAATTGGQYADSTVRAYASLARVASKAIEGLLGADTSLGGIAAARLELDRPYNDQLEADVQNANLKNKGGPKPRLCDFAPAKFSPSRHFLATFAQVFGRPFSRCPEIPLEDDHDHPPRSIAVGGQSQLMVIAP